MAQELPDALQLRHIKYSAKTQPAQQLEVARALLAAGRVAEALDLFLIAKDENGLGEIKQRALSEGRPVWLLMMRHDERAISAADWTACGAGAERAGRLREAFSAFTLADDKEAVARLRELLPDYEMYVTDT